MLLNNMDIFSKQKRSEIMSKIKGKRTKPEMVLHNWLKGNKICHKMWPDMFGNPDIFIKDFNLVIFVNGCFWHGCVKHFRLPKTDRKFWRKKIKRNIERQNEMIRKLRQLGFQILIIWEHDIKGTNNIFKNIIEKRI